jgi:hypothetical protein
MSYHIFCLLALVIGIITCNISFEESLASSPSFIRQTLIDNSNYWVDVANDKRTTNGIPSTDIRTVTYSSNGRTLEATFWLYSAFDKTLPDPYGNLNKISYGIFIDTDFDKQSEYRMEIQKFKERNWTKIVREFEPFFPLPKSSKFLEVERNYIGFFNKNWDDRYVNVTLDLADIGFPDRYQILFYTEQRLNCSGSACKTVKYDFTEWALIPPPSVSISTSPKSLEIIPGEEKTIDIEVNSTTDFQPVVQILAHNRSEIIISYPSNTTFQLPSYGIETIPLRIKMLQNVTTSRPTLHLPLYVNLTSPTEESFQFKPTNSAPTGEEIHLLRESVSNQTDKTILLLKVQKPLTPMESILGYLANFNSTVITPISGIWTFIIGVLTLGIPWAVRMYSQRKKIKIKIKKSVIFKLVAIHYLLI